MCTGDSILQPGWCPEHQFPDWALIRRQCSSLQGSASELSFPTSLMSRQALASQGWEDAKPRGKLSAMISSPVPISASSQRPGFSSLPQPFTLLRLAEPGHRAADGDETCLGSGCKWEATDLGEALEYESFPSLRAKH